MPTRYETALVHFRLGWGTSRYRRIALKASLQLLTGCLAGALTLLPTTTQAAPYWAPSLGIASAVAGQTAGSTDAKSQADELLRQARAAIKEGNYQQAEKLIGQAEALKVEYTVFMARWSDTPEKLRKLLAEEKTRKVAVPQKPSTKFPALIGQNNEAAPMPTGKAPVGNPEAALGQMMDDAKAKAKMFAEQGRAALQKGDKLAAQAAYQKSMGLKAVFAAGEYSPEHLAADLKKAGVDVSRMAPPQGLTAASPYQLKPSDVASQPEKIPALPEGSMPETNPADASPYTAAPAEGYPQTAKGSIYGSGEAAPEAAPAGHPAKADAQRLMAQARVAMDKGDLNGAMRLAEQATALGVPESAFVKGETRPWEVQLEVNRQMTRRAGVVPASGNIPDGAKGGVANGVYAPEVDTTKVQPASTAAAMNRAQGPGQGARLYNEGLAALEQQDKKTAMAKFSEAWRFQAELDPATRQQLQDKLSFLRAAMAQPVGIPGVQPASAGELPSPLEQVGSEQEVLRQRLIREVTSERAEAEKLAQSDPRGALAKLNTTRERINGTEMDAAGKKQLLALLDRSISELSAYVEANKATIDNKERNDSIKADIAREREMTYTSQQKLADLVEKFNQLMDDHRYAEAEVLAKQAREIQPDSPITETMTWKSTFARNMAQADSIKERKEAGFMGQMTALEESAIPFDDREPWVINDVRGWEQLTKSRKKLLQERTNLTPAEREIQQALNKTVELRFKDKPMAEVLDTLSKMSGVNIHADQAALHSEAVTSDTPVTIELNQPISLKSALNLILGPHKLSYVIQDDVLKVTSEQTKDSNVYAKVYYVADLVIPIPNFVPSYNMGLPGALRESLTSLGYGGQTRAMSQGPLTIAQNEENNLKPTTTSGMVLAQNNGMMPTAPGMGMRGPQTVGPGAGGMGGGVQADFDTLIELITSTIAPNSWDEVGGPGAISGFDANLSLVVSQTQEVHEKLADLLEQLRRLQDLQVTIEVRFITLSDRFFERIGVDFDFAISDKSGLNRNAGQLTFPESYYDGSGPSATIGISSAGTPTSTLDIAMTTGSGPGAGGFLSTTPQFGSYDANTATNFGFAILSDIEAWFILQAAQGDDRTNVLQAPKVTLFNGQQAFVSDTSQRPFVTSVIPVVGDFAAAYQPVIIVLNEGTSLSVQAVVSADRRFVRLTLVPFFSRIGDVETFQFTGSTTTDTGTAVQDPADKTKTTRNNNTTTNSGTTVQLPTFAFTTVTTTVSVPDGGTVLLGGIKRLREGRNERGTPLLSKIPYVSRLFRNVGIGRDAQSLMMMVTPRIIIQEEEEEKLGIGDES